MVVIVFPNTVIPMIGNDILYALRQLKRNKILAAINVLGLTIGISSCLVIFRIASYEMSFDTFQPDKDRIHRIYSVFEGPSSGTNRGVSDAVPHYVRENFTGVEAVANFNSWNPKIKVPSSNEVKSFESDGNTIITVPDYFRVFDYYQWIVGDAETSLSEPFRVVLTENRARSFFGNIPFKEMIGREVIYRDSLHVSVSGIVKDIEQRTDFDFTDFVSFSTVEKSWLSKNIRVNDWGGTNSGSQLFVKLSKGTGVKKVESQLIDLAKVYKEKNPDGDYTKTSALQPLSDLHFNTDLGIFDNSRSVANKATLQTLIIVAALLLIIAAINFINLETAQASKRAKEVGVRKVLGSSRGRLVRHFLVESFLLTTVAVVLSIGVAWLSIEYFREFLPKGLELHVTEPLIIYFLVGCIVGVTLLAGLYPAFVLSSYQPALALKNLAHRNSANSRSSFIRKGLTIFQFGFSQVMIVATLVVGMQISFMLNKDLGFDRDAIVYFNTPWYERASKRDAFHQKLEQLPDIEKISLQMDPPSSNGYSSFTVDFDNGSEILKHEVHIKYGDTAYLNLYHIPLLAGRNVLPRDTVTEYLINETYLHLLGFEDPRDAIGKVIHDKKMTIVGVMKDFHNKSLHSQIDPIVFSYDKQNSSCFGLKIAASKVSDIKGVMAKVESAWKEVYPDNKFEYQFLDETVKRFYETETRTATLTNIATGISILISCLGLFGLSSFTVIQRTKEIGIRKVLGASVNSILMLLSKDFLKLVVIAFVLAVPLAWYLIDLWLKDFAFRMDIGIWIFALGGVLSIAMAFFTISVKTVNAAKADPVDSLRYE